MDILGTTLALTGAALYLASLVLTIRANPKATLPYFGQPPVATLAMVVLRLAGTALLVIGAVALAPKLGITAISLVVAAPLVGAAIISLHNARVASRR